MCFFHQLEARADKLDSELKEKNKVCRVWLCLQVHDFYTVLVSFHSIILQEVSDLQEQLADLMRHLDAQQAIANAPDKTRQVSRRFSFQ